MAVPNETPQGLDEALRVGRLDSPYGSAAAARPSWARWNPEIEQRCTVGVEEELLLMAPPHFALAESSDSVLRDLSDELAGQVSPETHAPVLEVATGIHSDVAGAVAELSRLRARLARELAAMDLVAASSGTYPLAHSDETKVSGSPRYQVISDSMRALARRDPTAALHVHVGVPDPEDAVRVLNGLRGALPVLLALSANSPFSRGCDTGFASARTMIFGAFPRTGIARQYADYSDYVEAVDALIVSGALPDPTFLWWDVRLQPVLGTVEVRGMDTQMSVADSGALIALVVSLSRAVLEAQEDLGRPGSPEVLAENRFLAARDGLDARLIDPLSREVVPARAVLDALVSKCRSYADPVGLVELDRVSQLATATGAQQQRACARAHGLAGLASMLSRRFAPPGGIGGRHSTADPAETVSVDLPRQGSVSTHY